MANRVTFVPDANAALQVVPQLILPGRLTIVPSPKSCTVNAYCPAATGANVACIAVLKFIVRSHVLAPLQAPLQPTNR